MTTTSERTLTLPAMSNRARTAALICLLAASFIELMDATVVNVALPDIQRDLGAGRSALQWVAAGYPLAYAVGLILGARLGDRFGRRRLFIIGLAGFGVTSLLCGLAVGAGQLVAFRLIQGAAAALMVPQVLTNIQIMYPPAERGRAMGLFTSVIGIAAVAGPMTGGVLTQADLFGWGWRPIFLINVPIAAAAVIAARVLVPESRAERPAPISLGSALLLGAAMASVMLAITLGAERHWPAWAWLLLVAGAGLAVVFARTQRRAEAGGRVALVPPSLFTEASFRCGLLLFGLLSMPTGGFFLIQSVHVQEVLGWSALQTGLAYVPFSIATSVGAGLAATRLVQRWGGRVIRSGAVTFAVGMLALVLVVDHGWLPILLGLVLAGSGFGLIVGSAGLLVLHRVDPTQAGAASGVFNTVQALAGAAGAAGFGTIYLRHLAASPDAAYTWAMLAMAGLLVVGTIVGRAVR